LHNQTTGACDAHVAKSVSKPRNEAMGTASNTKFVEGKSWCRGALLSAIESGSAIPGK
jgi:hypothetical protein